MTSPLAAMHLLIGDQVGRCTFHFVSLGALAVVVAGGLQGDCGVPRMLPHGSEIPSLSSSTAGVRLVVLFGGTWRSTPGARDVMGMALGFMAVVDMDD
jgi:hypothetical protein